MSSNSDDIIWREAIEALHGADDVIRRLQILVNSKAPSIADMAYTIRTRKKEDYKIVEKVKRKRVSNPAYCVKDIRDIVGLRIVTVYRLDALDILPHLVDLIRADAGKNGSFFVSPEFEEIKIYSTNPHGDAQALPQRLMSLFDSLGYGRKAHIENAPSNYTSIHLVTWCRGKYDKGFVEVPVEIQIRTALEDAWGEIDHKLKYKRSSHELSVRDETVLRVCLAHLNIMKIFVDGAAQYADQIRVQSDQTTARRFISTTHRIVQDTIAIVHEMKLPPHIRSQIEYGLEQQREAMDPSRKTVAFAVARLGHLRNAIRELETCIELVGEQIEGANEHKESLLSYLLPMELALCKFQLGIELKDDKLHAEAIRLYQTVEIAFPKRAVVRYRYGRVLATIGDIAAAVTKVTEAQNLIQSGDDNTVGSDHWLRLSVPRILGVYFWESAEALRTDRQPTSKEKEKIRELNLQAYAVTRKAYDSHVILDLNDPFEPPTNYRIRLANNLLYYLWDFMAAGGNEPELAKYGHRSSDIQDFLSLIEEHADQIEAPAILHTMLRHYRRLGKHERSRFLASRLKKILRNQGVSDSGGNSHEEVMLRLALEILGDQDPGNEGTPS